MALKKGDKVTWISAANGSWKEKTGVIVKAYREGGEERFQVSVAPPEGSKAAPKLYCPRTSALRPA